MHFNGICEVAVIVVFQGEQEECIHLLYIFVDYSCNGRITMVCHTK